MPFDATYKYILMKKLTFPTKCSWSNILLFLYKLVVSKWPELYAVSNNDLFNLWNSNSIWLECTLLKNILMLSKYQWGTLSKFRYVRYNCWFFYGHKCWQWGIIFLMHATKLPKKMIFWLACIKYMQPIRIITIYSEVCKLNTISTNYIIMKI